MNAAIRSICLLIGSIPVAILADESSKRASGQAFVVDPRWEKQAAEDARQDRTTIVFDGESPNRLACDTTLRLIPDGSWVVVMLGGGDSEPRPENQVFLTRSLDQGRTWSPMKPLDFGFPREGNTIAMVQAGHSIIRTAL